MLFIARKRIFLSFSTRVDSSDRHVDDWRPINYSNKAFYAPNFKWNFKQTAIYVEARIMAYAEVQILFANNLLVTNKMT